MTATGELEVVELTAEDAPRVVEVHCDAFFDYPTMRDVLGAGGEYPERLRTLIALFIDGTLLRGGVLLGAVSGDDLVGAADLVPSEADATGLEERRRRAWESLGEGARRRYEDYSRITAPFEPSRPHLYLSMLGVRRAATGRGVAGRLLEAAHRRSLEDPRSEGVALETEDPDNVSFYEHFGYRRVGYGRTSSGLESWGFFRPDP